MINPDEIKGIKILKFKKKFKKTVLQRYLVSKFLWDTSNFELKDLAALYFNQLQLEDMFRKGEDKSIKDWREDLSQLSELLKEFNFSNNLTTRGVENFGKKLVASNFTKLVCPQRNYKGLKDQIDPYFDFIELKENEIFPEKTPEKPKAYIGKGYTDKGSRKNPGEDGSPSWQEVAKSDKTYPIPGERDYDKKRKEEINEIAEAIKLLKRDIRETRIRRRGQG